jgi:hypothetical protein
MRCTNGPVPGGTAARASRGPGSIERPERRRAEQVEDLPVPTFQQFGGVIYPNPGVLSTGRTRDEEGTRLASPMVGPVLLWSSSIRIAGPSPAGRATGGETASGTARSPPARTRRPKARDAFSHDWGRAENRRLPDSRGDAARLGCPGGFARCGRADEPQRHDHQLHHQSCTPQHSPELRPGWPRVHGQDGAEPDQRPCTHHQGSERPLLALNHRLHSRLRLPSTHHQDHPRLPRRSRPGRRSPLRPRLLQVLRLWYPPPPLTSSFPTPTTSAPRSSTLPVVAESSSPEKIHCCDTGPTMYGFSQVRKPLSVAATGATSTCRRCRKEIDLFDGAQAPSSPK